MSSKNLLRDGVIAGFRVVSIEKKEFTSKLQDGSGGVKTVNAFKFVAKLRHDQATSVEADYAETRDPDGTLDLSYYMWGYIQDGKPILGTKRASGMDYGACFLSPEKYKEMLSTAGYNPGTKKCTGIVFCKVRLTQAQNYLTHEFGGKEFKAKKEADVSDMWEMVNNAATTKETVSDDPMSLVIESENKTKSEEPKKPAKPNKRGQKKK